MSSIKTLLLLLALLCAFHLSPLCEAAVCYVKPTEPNNATCPSEPCYTLDEYVSSSSRYFVSDTIFMFLNGNHDLSYTLAKLDIRNVTLMPYRDLSNVVIEFEYMVSLMFTLASDIVIRGMTFKAMNIVFENCENVTLSGLTGFTAESNTAIVMNNVYGAVEISYFNCFLNCDFGSCQCITFEWTNIQFQPVPNTVVLLRNLVLYLIGLSSYNYGVSFSGCFAGKIVVMDSTFSYLDNVLWYGIDMSVSPSCNGLLFECKHTIFDNYNIVNGLSVTVETPQYYHEHTMAVTLHNVSFHDNITPLSLENVQNVTISDCSFKNSSSNGAITATNSILSLTGDVTFTDNLNYQEGGAIALFGDSRILIPEPNNTYILFENNTADNVGGAIYFSGSDTYMSGLCKIYLKQDASDTVFNFSMNTAANGGNAIYGAYLHEPCYLPNGTLFQNLSQLILSASSFTPSFADDPSVISSDAQMLCFCDEDGELGDCNGTQGSVYPGQVFKLSFASLGDMNGLVRWPVYANADPGSLLGNVLQHSQNTNAQRCTDLQYSILSKETQSTLTFSLQSVKSDSLMYHVHLLPCPLGFILDSIGECICLKYLILDLEIILELTCNITEQSIERQGTIWIGVLEKNTINILVFSTVCPFLYCKRSRIKIYLNESSILDEDIQCNYNRSGVLCGGCSNSLSLALGSNRCLHGCSNDSLSLIIAFAAAGIALVFFIKILNLTVSQGTINGLIFYANIMGAEQSVLFASRTHEGFLSVFIAWANLNLGIETCFFDGMDAYAKAWLQFVFPVYVWTIALFIIILSHYSIRVSKLFGNNSVPVLATLIFLSYSKLLQAVISALSVTDIQFQNGSTMSVWEKDGNILYLTGKHIPLFVFAVAVLVLLWFPFTLVLVSIQWLQRGTHYRVLRWVTKLIPFFDAFTGPFKNNHRYWVGALLLVRCILLMVFNIYTADGSGVAFISIIFAALVILAVSGSMYKNMYLAILEISYILNLGILAAGFLYVQYIYESGSQEALVTTSVGIAFLQFLATVIYHAYVQLREPLNKLKVKMRGQNGHERDEYEQINESLSVEEPLERPPYQEIGNFREPLLAYLND